MEEQMFGKIMQEERKRQGLSCQQLADMTGFTVRSIYFWENGQRNIGLGHADAVLKALNASMTIGKEDNGRQTEDM
ncbi:MAG: helix-turn-helix domain-containing protein [Lachnospiraceae bacterium]|nr:helix-turn-helix domain-containing protein [Lachnospiraceae bacterium]